MAPILSLPSEPYGQATRAGAGYRVMVLGPVRQLGAALLVCALLGSCSDDDADEPGDLSADHSADHASMSVVDHCSGRMPDETDATLSELEADGMRLVAADFPAPAPSGTVLVLLHQTGTLGLCGWSRFAPEAAAAGLPSVAIDMCGFGGSDCDDGEATPPEDQVALAAAHARDELGAEKVVLVGASMGGAQTVIAVADGAEVDGWVDVSSPDVWEGTTLVDRAADVRARGLPGLVAHAADDNDEWYAGAQALAEAAGARFLDGDSGHGWDLLNDTTGALRPDGQTVIDFALGV